MVAAGLVFLKPLSYTGAPVASSSSPLFSKASDRDRAVRVADDDGDDARDAFGDDGDAFGDGVGNGAGNGAGNGISDGVGDGVVLMSGGITMRKQNR